MKALAVLLLLAGVAQADTLFDRGKIHVSGGGGSSSAFGSRYFGVGVGAGYFVLDGVEVGLEGEVDWGNGPTISRLTPSLRYIVQPLVGKFPLIPYAGVFYSHWFVGESIADADAIGTRGGVLYLSGSIVVGLGVVFEHVVSECIDDCNAVYPDITLGFAF